MKFHRAFVRVTAAVIFALTLVNCSPPAGRDAAGGKLLIVTTTTMVTDLVRSIAGDDAIVQPLMGPGVDPHLFKPGQEDIQHLQKADIIFYSGLHLEGRMTEIMERLKGQGRKVYAIADAIDEGKIIKADGQHDPHIWGDASQWAYGARLVGEKLGALLGDRIGGIPGRAAAAEMALMEAHARLVEAAATLPPEKRVLITSHDAFRYFGRAYGFDVIGVQGISTVSEAALADMARISDTVKQRGVKAIFVESSVSTATIERISKDTGAKIGGELFSDALGKPGDMITINGRSVDRGTTAGMLESNMHTIVKALK